MSTRYKLPDGSTFYLHTLKVEEVKKLLLIKTTVTQATQKMGKYKTNLSCLSRYFTFGGVTYAEQNGVYYWAAEVDINPGADSELTEKVLRGHIEWGRLVIRLGGVNPFPKEKYNERGEAWR